MRDIWSHIKIEKDIPVPIYYQLKNQLEQLIVKHMLEGGDMIPPENEFCVKLNISRPTVRQALSELVDAGMLVRYKGKGTFVSKPKVQDRFLSKLQSFNEEMRDKGMVPHTEIIAFEKRPPSPNCNSALGLSDDEPLLFLARLRYADDVQMVFVETHLSYNKFSGLLDVDLSNRSLYEVLEEEFNLRVDRATREIEAVNAHKNVAEILGISRGKAISRVTSISYAGNKQIEYSIAHYRGDRTRFIVDTSR